MADDADGERALSLCRRLRPELVLVGLRLPKMDGLEAIRAIRGEFPATRVLVLAAFEDPDRLAEALKADASGYVLKSASPARIVQAVREVLRGGTPLDEEVSARLLMRLLERSPEEAHGTPGEDLSVDRMHFFRVHPGVSLLTRRLSASAARFPC